MKVRLLIYTILGLLFSLQGAYSQSVNKLSIPVTDGGLGSEISIPVSLTNSDGIVAMQLNMTFPEGATVNASEVILADRKEDHTIVVRSLGKNDYLFIIFSSSNKPLRGNSGVLFRIPVKLPMTWDENALYPMQFNQVILSNDKGDNVAIESDPGAIRVVSEPRPDIAVQEITFDKNLLSPGEKVNISWLVNNVGDKATAGGWSEQVVLIADNGEQVFLGSLSYTQLLNAEATVSRQAELILPELPGIGGDVKVQVKLIPTPELGELISAQDNNIGKSEKYLKIGKLLKLELPVSAIMENNSRPVSCKLFRSGSWIEDQSFTLKSGDSERLTVPSTVVIPKGQSGVVFYMNVIDNTVLNEDSTVTITAEGNGYEPVTETVTIEDDEIPALSVHLSKSELNEGETFVLTIESERVASSPLTININCDHPKRFKYPEKVEMPAGKRSVSVEVSTVDDNIPDVTITAEFIVSAAGHKSAKGLAILHDNDLPEISLTLTPEAVSESAGPRAVIGLLRRLNNTDSNIIVNLTDDSEGDLFYSPSNKRLEMAPGVQEVRFTIGVVDNAIVEGDREVTVKAAVYLSSCDCSATGTNAGTVEAKLTILDDDGPALKITSSQTMLLEGKENATILTVSRNTSTTEELAVEISSDYDSDLEYEKRVIIPAGAESVDVPVSVKSNDIVEGDRTVTFTVNSEGYTKGVCWVMVTDQTLPDAVISNIVLSRDEVEAGGTIEVSVTVMNDGVAPLTSQTKVNLYLSNSTDILHTYYTQKALSPGESELLTGTISMPDITGNYTLSAVVNEDKKVKELLYINNNSEQVPVKLLPHYVAAVSTNKQVYSQGEEIRISGTATGNNTQNATVEIYIINSGIRQTINATTDGNGRFEATFQPSAYQSGRFIVGACYPNEGLTDEQAVFDVYGLQRATQEYISHQIFVDEPYEGVIALSNPGVLKLTNINTEVIFKPDNYDIEFETISEINGGATAELKFKLTGKAPSEIQDWELINIRIKTAEDVSLDIPIRAYCRSQKGQLKPGVTSINTTMTKGSVRDYSFTITNVGKGETGRISLSLPSNAPWMTTVTPKEMSSLKPDETATIILRFTPTDNLPLNVAITGSIGVNCENGTGFPLQFRVEPVSTSTGKLIVDVCDEYTYYTPEGPHLEGASVVLRHVGTNQVLYEGKTNTEGLFVVEEMPEGYYAIEVSADKHDRYKNNILVDPGKENKLTVNLSFQAITINWEVEETTVEDEYEIITKVEYEVNVPVPVVVTQVPDQIPVDELMEKGIYMFNAVLINKGLITAKDVRLTFPEYEALSIEYPAMDNVNLRPQESIVVPVKISLKSRNRESADSSLELKRALRLQLPCRFEPVTFYMWDCGLDRKWHQYPVTIKLLVCKSAGSAPSGGGGGFGGGGFGGGGGGGYYGGSSTTEPITEYKGCEPCQNSFFFKIVAGCFLKRVPVIATVLEIIDVLECVQEVIENGKILCLLEQWVKKPVWLEKIIDYIDIYEDCIKPIFEPCVPGEFFPEDTPLRSEVKYPDYILHYQRVMLNATSMIDASKGKYLEVFGDSVWLSVSGKELTDLSAELRSLNAVITEGSTIYDLKPLSITHEQFNKFVERWNNTFNKITSSPNYISEERIDQHEKKIVEVKDFAKSLGYSSVPEMVEKETEIVVAKLNESSNSVCATISLQFTQKLTLTRQAFKGTLTVFNGHADTAMKDVKLNLIVRDEEGNVMTPHEFQININNETLIEFKNGVANTWTLDAQKTGIATVTFIPTKYAAPTEPKDYSFGGTLSYLDPFTGLEVTRDLFPVTLTVKPSPDLNLTYFMQRDVLGDDPLTEEVEPMIPSEFSLIINNVGTGEASNVRMLTYQPEIVANDKDLLIDFEMISSQQNGQEKVLVFGESAYNEFGDIQPGQTVYAQWWFTASLLGHFVNYDIEVNHLTGFDNPDLSLLNEVTIHELIRSIIVPLEGNNFLTGFLANDIPDSDDFPDILYFSDGTTAPVALTTTAVCNPDGTNKYKLTVTPKETGWNYGYISDPTNGRQKLIRVTRVSDNMSINLRNFWQTDRTLRDGRDPLYENRLHFVDNLLNGNEDYILEFEPRPDIVLAVESFGNVPASGEIASNPVTEIVVRFNKSIDSSTFTTEDIRLNCQGQMLDASKIVIIGVSDREYKLDVSALTLADGYYVLTIQTAGITDHEGYKGETGEKADWVQYVDGKVNLSIKILPENSGTVTPSSGAYEHGEVINLHAEPKTGYLFEKWMIDGNTLSTEPDYAYTILSATTITANFKLKLYDVTLEYDRKGGSVSGGGTGKYEHGYKLSLKALPATGYVLKHWKVNGKVIDNTSGTFETFVESDLEIEAVFAETGIVEETIVYNLSTGWNWISANVADSKLNDPVALFTPLINNLLSVKGQGGNLVNDPEHGLSGSLDEIVPGSSYKINMSNPDNLTMTGIPFSKSDVTLTVNRGWNWIGYTPDEEMSVNNALLNLIADGNDVIKGQDAFSIFHNNTWIGSLQTLVPGEGYNYYAHSVKSFSYNINGGRSVSPQADGYTYRSLWNYDKYKYADNMSIVARIYNESEQAVPGKYSIGAYVGNECRGMGVEINGYFFITVNGENTEESITFKVIDISSGEIYPVKESVQFTNDIVGNMINPLELHFTDPSGIDENGSGFVVYPNPVKDMLFINGDYNSVKDLRVIDARGVTVLIPEVDSSEAGIDVSGLLDGTYVLIINTQKNVAQHRFVKLSSKQN